jgi:hypothetical protein
VIRQSEDADARRSMSKERAKIAEALWAEKSDSDEKPLGKKDCSRIERAIKVGQARGKISLDDRVLCQECKEIFEKSRRDNWVKLKLSGTKDGS